MNKLQWILILVLIYLFSSFSVHAADISKSSFEARVHDGHLCPRNSAWFSAKNFVMNGSEIKILDNGDARLIFKNVSKAGDGSTSEAILVAGRALLTKNIQIEENYAIDVLDTAVLLHHLIITLIDLVCDKGPRETTFPVQSKIVEPKYPIKVTTRSASGFYKAPWAATVDLTRKDDDVINYRIAFSFTTRTNNKGSLTLNGRLSNYDGKKSNSALPDDFNISEWQQYNIGFYSKKVDRGEIFDFGTTYIKPSFSTLGQLRKYINEKDKQKRKE